MQTLQGSYHLLLFLIFLFLKTFFTQMEERMGEIERVVLSLSAGKLCKDVLPPKQLSQTLHNIERQLPGNYTLVTFFNIRL